MRRTLSMAAALLLSRLHASHAENGVVSVEACVGPAGQLRLAGNGCRPSERPIGWQRGGGVWVHDALGRPLGRSMDRDGFWIHNDTAGPRVWISSFTGTPQTRSLSADCAGRAVAACVRSTRTAARSAHFRTPIRTRR
jgi:hypothetical protein